MKIYLIILLFIWLIFLPGETFAQLQSNSFISVVNPIRGSDFWNLEGKPIDAVKGQMDILTKENVPSTWLLRFDAFNDQEIVNLLQKSSDVNEKGLFIEVTPTLTKAANVKYNQSASWHNAKSVLLTGYSPDDRVKLIDTSFATFKKTFGYYPKSVGAWWVDAYSLDYMQKKYGVTGALIVADQYSTDDYQIWGQYFGTPYYPMRKNALAPAQSENNKIPLVIMQWATRDPVNGYGKGVEESTYSVQANDYLDYHNLDTNYFGKLIDIYTTQKYNQINHLVVGLENSYSWQKYKSEYQNQILLLRQKSLKGQFSLVNMQSFANIYKLKFPGLSPPQIIVSDDPLGSNYKSVWFMNNFYRVGWFYNQEGSVVRDIRQYIDGSEEICFSKPCDSVNFATFATRVLDDVTNHQKWALDEGQINSINVSRDGQNYVLSYKNSADLIRNLEFLPRDISWEGKSSTIDGLILDISSKQPVISSTNTNNFQSILNLSLTNIYANVLNLIKFLLFLIIAIFVPGFILIRKINASSSLLSAQILFLSLITGFVSLTFTGFLIGLLKLDLFIYLYIFLNLVLALKLKLYKVRFKLVINRANLIVAVLIVLGTIFQVLPVYKSGQLFSYGMGLWGPNTHDGIWHISLIDQLIRQIPPENPVFGGSNLENYHYFYDLLVAWTFKLTSVPTIDLVFRIYPVVFSLLLGIGSYLLSYNLFKSKRAGLFSLYFVYFAGSFGFIISILKHQEWGGESAFWANQSISFNLNPPFAISLLIIISIFLLFDHWFIKPGKILSLLISLLAGTLIAFKAYAAILLISALVVYLLFIRQRKKIFLIFSGILLLTILTLLPQYNLTHFLSNNTSSAGLFVFAPFWFVHSMIDNPDRVGWSKLSAARDAYLQRKDWFKFVFVESLGLIIFIAGNLGLRILGFIKIFKPGGLNNTKKLVLIFTFISFLIPIFFIQTGTPWNTIQFFYYGMFILAIFSGIALQIVFEKLPKSINFLLVALILIITPISSLTTARSYLTNIPHAYIGNDEIQALNFLNTQPIGLVLTYPYDKTFKDNLAEPWPLFAYDTTAYVSALSGKSSFVEDETQNQILQTDYIKRIIISKEIFNQKQGFAHDNLIKNNIEYIYLPKFFNRTLSEPGLGIKKIFENKGVLIYQINNET